MEAFAANMPLAFDFEQRFNAVITGLRGAEGRKDEACFELQRLTRDLAAVPLDAALAMLAAEIDQCKDLSGKILAARGDCPKREADWKRLHTTQGALCTRLGVSIETVPQLLVEQRKRIELQSGRHLVLESKRLELPTKVAGLELGLREAESVLADLPAETDTAELAERLAQVRSKKQPELEAKRLRLERDAFAEQLSRDLGALPYWTGTSDQLETMRVPLAASVGVFAERFVKHQSRAQQLAEDFRHITAEAESCSRGLRRLERQQSIPTESELAEARARRENGWTAVKEQWIHGLRGGPTESSFLEAGEQSLPKAYEAAVQNADSVADRLRLEADRVEQKRGAIESLAAAKQRLSDNERAQDQHREELARLEAEWKNLWAETPITPHSPREMQSWLESRGTIVGQVRELNRLSSQVTEAEEEAKRWRETLSTLLGETQESGLSELVNRADIRVRQSVETRRNRGDAAARIRELRSNLDAARGDLWRNESELAGWGTEWAAALRGLPVSGSADPAAVQEVVRLIDQGFIVSEEMSGLQYRIDAMKMDEANYVEAVRRLALRAGRQDLAAGDALLAISELQRLARVAQSNETKAAGIVENQMREQRKLSDAQAGTARYQTALEELRLEAQVEEANLLPEVIRASQGRLELAARIEGHRAALASSSGGLTFDEFISQVHNTNLDLLPDELEQARQEISRLEDARASKTSERDGIDREFQLREAATALSTASCEKFLAAARIDALGCEYLEQQIGAALLSKAMTLYREKNQDPLLKRAGDYFATLTCGAFSTLAINDFDNQRVLQGVRAVTHEHLDVNSMSDGTRDQLFLALRLAYIENYCDTTTACPVILDDVLMAFDEARAGAALRALHDLSRKTQVLVFTHHAHHVKLAERILGNDGFQLHDLNWGNAGGLTFQRWQETTLESS